MTTTTNIWQTLRYRRLSGREYIDALYQNNNLAHTRDLPETDILQTITASEEVCEVDLVRLTGHELGVPHDQLFSECGTGVDPLPEYVYPFGLQLGLTLCEPEVVAELCLQLGCGVSGKKLLAHFGDQPVINVATRTVIPTPRNANAFKVWKFGEDELISADVGSPEVAMMCAPIPKDILLARPWIFTKPRR
jgi:hypothetical protein